MLSLFLVEPKTRVELVDIVGAQEICGVGNPAGRRGWNRDFRGKQRGRKKKEKE